MAEEFDDSDSASDRNSNDAMSLSEDMAGVEAQVEAEQRPTAAARVPQQPSSR